MEPATVPPLIAPALASLGVSASLTGPLSNLLFTGITVGLSILFAPDVPKPEDGKTPFRQAVPPRIRIIGRRRTGGAYMLYHAKDDGLFLAVHALCEGKANAITRMYLHETPVQFTTPDGPYIQSAGGGLGRYGDDKVRIFSRLGLHPETAYAEAVAEIPSIWTTDHRGDGICSVLMLADDAEQDKQGKRYPGGIPVFTAEIDATQVYDPRDDDVQDYADRTTWSGSHNDNPILQAMWFLTAPTEQGGCAIDIAEAFAPVMGAIKVQADICDALVPLKTGAPRERYRSGALYEFENGPGEVLSAILGTCDGFCAENGDGTFTLKAGLWDDDDFSVVILDKHIISMSISRFKPDEDEVTGVIVKYNSVEHEHTTIDAPVWPRDAYQGGNDRRVRTIDIGYCPDGYQAQRLAKRVATYEMAEVSGTAVLKMWGVQLINKRGATIQCSDDPALANCKVRLTKVETNLVEGTVSIAFTVFDPVACDAWNPATEEGPIQPIISVPVDDGFTTPGNLVAAASQIGSATFVVIRFDPGVVASEKTAYRYRYRIVDIGGGVPGGWVNGEIDANSVVRTLPTTWYVTISGLPGAVIEIELQAHQKDYSSWSAAVRVDTTVLSPGQPTNFTAVASGANANLAWKQPNSDNVTYAYVYRANPPGSPINLASPIASVSGTARAALTYTDTPATGTYDYWVVAMTAMDIASLEAGPITVVIP